MIRINIITHNRPDEVLLLLDDISRENPPNAFVCVYEDPSAADYRSVVDYCTDRQWWFVTAPEHYGKPRHWQLVSDVYASAAYTPERMTFFQFPDDIRLCKDFFKRALALWEGIEDPKKLALNLLRDKRADGMCWTPIDPQDAGDVLKVGWVDGLFVADRRYFSLLDYKVAPVTDRCWKTSPNLGSGVYQNVSCSLFQQGNFYCVKQSLVVHTNSASQMNPVARQQHPLRAVNFIDGDEAHDRLANHGIACDDS